MGLGQPLRIDLVGWFVCQSVSNFYHGLSSHKDCTVKAYFTFVLVGPGGLRAPCVAWPLLLPLFSLFLFFLSVFCF